MRPRPVSLRRLAVCVAMASIAGCNGQQAPPAAPPVETHKSVQQQIKDIENNPGIPPAAKQHAIQQLQSGTSTSGKP